MAIDAQSVVLTDEVVKARLEQLVGAAAKGGARNALSDLTSKARNELVSSATPEGIVEANEKVMGQWLSIQQKNLADGKPNGEKTDHVGLIKSVLNFDFIGIAFTVLKDKIAIFTESAFESFSNKDEKRNFGSIFAEKTQEYKIRNFAEKNGIDGDRLLAEIKNPPKETQQLASLKPEEQLKRLNDIKIAEEQKAELEKKAAEDAEVAKQVRAAEQFEAARKRLEAKTSEQPTGNGEEKKSNTGKKDTKNAKGTKTSTIIDAQDGLKGIASEVVHADRGANQTPLTNNAIIGGTASQSL